MRRKSQASTQDTISALLRRVRKCVRECGLSPEELEQRGVAGRRTIEGWLSKRYDPSAEAVGKLALATGWSEAWLLNERGPANGPLAPDLVAAVLAAHGEAFNAFVGEHQRLGGIRLETAIEHLAALTRPVLRPTAPPTSAADEGGATGAASPAQRRAR